MQIEVDGIAFSYDEYGEGRPILMLHGWPGSRVLMTNPLEPLFEGRSGWRRIYPDLPGMGATPGPDSISDQMGMLRATQRFMDAVAPGERFALVGVSYGGYLALGMLHEWHARIDGLALWSPMLAHTSKATIPEHQVLFHDPAVDGELADEERVWLEVSVVQTPRTLTAFRASVKPGLMAADRDFLRRVLQRFEFPFDARVLEAPFDRPSLLLVGHQDSAVGYADLTAMLESFPRGTLAVVDRAGHGIAEEQRDVFGTLFGDWLDRMALEAGEPGPPARRT